MRFSTSSYKSRRVLRHRFKDDTMADIFLSLASSKIYLNTVIIEVMLPILFFVNFYLKEILQWTISWRCKETTLLILVLSEIVAEF